MIADSQFMKLELLHFTNHTPLIINHLSLDCIPRTQITHNAALPPVDVVVIFGATRLPQIGKGLGEGIRNFRSATKTPPEIDSPKIEVGPKPENETKDA